METNVVTPARTLGDTDDKDETLRRRDERFVSLIAYCRLD